MVYAENEGEVFLGRSVTRQVNVSEATMQKVDSEMRRIIDEQYQVAYKILDEHRETAHLMAKTLLEFETIDAEQIDDIMAGRAPRPPRDWSPSGGTGAGGSGGSRPDAAPVVPEAAPEVPVA
jgi:cell division protease FtsH